LELRELKARFSLLGVCTSCPVLRSDLEASAVEIKDLKHKLEHPSHYTILSPPCETCGSLKGKLFLTTKENTKLQQEVAYFTTHLEKTKLNEKMIEDYLSRDEKSVTKSTYKLDVGFERCENKGEKSAPKFIPNSTYHQEEKIIKSIKSHYPSNPKPCFNPKRELKKETPSQQRKLFFACFVTVLITWMSFTSAIRGLRRGVLIMLETQIVMSSFIFRLVLILVFCLALTLVLRLTLFLMLCLSSLVDLTIAHMIFGS
jgi:hypothetical protein